MKLAVDHKSVELKISPTKRVETWVYGTFQLRLGGSLIGDEHDNGVDLMGCINWLSDFIAKPRDRLVPELMVAPKEVVWQNIVVPVFESVTDVKYPDVFSRFHLSHLGMSAFDRVIIVMINDGKEQERYVWQQGEEPIQDFLAPIGSLEVAATEAITLFYEQMGKRPPFGLPPGTGQIINVVPASLG